MLNDKFVSAGEVKPKFNSILFITRLRADKIIHNYELTAVIAYNIFGLVGCF